MSALLISRAVRSEVKALLTAQFNDLLAQACDEFDISSEAFEIAYYSGANFFEAPFTFMDLKDQIGEASCAQTVSTRNAIDEHAQCSTTFSGAVTVQVETFLSWRRSAAAGLRDAESLCDAVESALVSILRAMNPRSGSPAFERTELIFDTGICYRSVVCTAELDVTV